MVCARCIFGSWNFSKIISFHSCFFRFLERSQLNTFERLEVPRHSYESELANLHDTVQQYVSSLLTDQQNIVKRTLIENGIVKLCLFFGVHKCKWILMGIEKPKKKKNEKYIFEPSIF